MTGPTNQGLVRTRGGSVIHCATCRHAKNSVRWDWADGRAFIEIRMACTVYRLTRCRVCKPAEGAGHIRSAGPWYVPFNSGHANPIPHIECEGGGRLEFDPPNILFIPGGSRVRIESFETDHPLFAVERFDRTVERYRLRVLS